MAVGCGFTWADEFEMTWAASLRSHSRLAPNMMLYWSLIERAIEEGCRTPRGGTHRFKKQWGGRDEQLYWYQLAGGRRKKTPSPDDSGYSWGPRLWRRLPLPIANRLGTAIVKGVP